MHAVANKFDWIDPQLKKDAEASFFIALDNQTIFKGNLK